MPKKFPDFKTDDDADAWLQSADLSEYDLSQMRKVRFELERKDTSISLRLPSGLLATLKARAAKAKLPMQRLIRIMIEAQLAKETTAKKSVQKTPRGAARAGKRAA